MPGGFCVPDASAKCSSARAVTAGSSTAGCAVAALPEANRYARRGGVTSNRDAAGTAMPSASAATASGAAKGAVGEK